MVNQHQFKLSFEFLKQYFQENILNFSLTFLLLLHKYGNSIALYIYGYLCMKAIISNHPQDHFYIIFVTVTDFIFLLFFVDRKGGLDLAWW